MSESRTPTGSDAPVAFMKSANEVIRNQALGAATSLVDYRSEGHCLVVGDSAQALALVEQLDGLTVTVLEIEPSLSRPEKQLTETGIHVYRGPKPDVQGYLGAFQVQWSSDERLHDLGVMRMTQSGCFDLMLDLSAESLLQTTLLPFGYFHTPDQGTLAAAVEQLPDMTGDFEKPRYFDYDPKICAHSRSKLIGCSKCVDVCVADAIVSQGEGVEVNPYLCQGCGSCASVCPTGAMTYAYPRPSEAIDRTREMIAAGDHDRRILVVYSGSDDEATDLSFEQTLPIWCLPIAVEEVTAYGIDYWASMFAGGCDRVVVVLDSPEGHPGANALQSQMAILRAILAPLGFTDDCLMLVTGGRAGVASAVSAEPEERPGSAELPRFTTHNDKRQTLRTAVDQLIKQHSPEMETVPLPPASPFGRVDASDACTLCLACVSVCPAGALLDGQDVPRLRFIESNCVQCGLCEQACPEDAISLTTQYTYDSVTARTSETLNEEEPFNCIRCNKPFGTRKMIDTMTGKLSGHWMFAEGKALRRLKMCDNCRVIDMFEDDAKGIDVHRGEPDA